MLKAVVYEVDDSEEESFGLFGGLTAHTEKLSEEQIGDQIMELRTHPTTKAFQAFALAPTCSLP